MARDETPDAWRATGAGLGAYRLAFIGGLVLAVGALVLAMANGFRLSWATRAAFEVTDVARALIALGGVVWLAARTPRGAGIATVAALVYGAGALLDLVGLVWFAVGADSSDASGTLFAARLVVSVAGTLCVALALAAIGRVLGRDDIVSRARRYVSSVVILGVAFAVLFPLSNDGGVIVVMCIAGIYGLVNFASYIMLLGHARDAIADHAPLPPRARAEIVR